METQIDLIEIKIATIELIKAIEADPNIKSTSMRTDMAIIHILNLLNGNTN